MCSYDDTNVSGSGVLLVARPMHSTHCRYCFGRDPAAGVFNNASPSLDELELELTEFSSPPRLSAAASAAGCSSSLLSSSSITRSMSSSVSSSGLPGSLEWAAAASPLNTQHSGSYHCSSGSGSAAAAGLTPSPSGGTLSPSSLLAQRSLDGVIRS